MGAPLALERIIKMRQPVVILMNKGMGRARWLKGYQPSSLPPLNHSASQISSLQQSRKEETRKGKGGEAHPR